MLSLTLSGESQHGELAVHVSGALQYSFCMCGQAPSSFEEGACPCADAPHRGARRL